MGLAATMDDFGGDAALAGAGRHVPTSRPLQRAAQVTHVGSDPVHDTDTAQGNGNMADASAGSKLRARIDTRFLSETEIRDYVARSLDELGRSAKELAREADTTPAAVKNWREQRNTMSLTNFARLAQTNATFRRFAARLIGLEADVVDHHEWQQEMAKFARYTAEIAARNGRKE